MYKHNYTERMENHHEYLPYEILTDILSRLPADSTIRFKCVCKSWRSIIEEDHVFNDMCVRRLVCSASASASASTSSSRSLGFITLETHKNFSLYTHNVCFAEYKHDDQKVMNFKKWRLPFKDTSPSIHEGLAIVGSCNGLICISVIPNYYDNQKQPQQHNLLVCNPLIGEVVNLSDSSSSSSSSINSLSFVRIGFGYLPSTNEYKIVRMYTLKRRIKHVQVYTLGSRKWRSINVPQITSSWPDIRFCFGVSVNVNGALYFNNYRNIVSFDLATEEFRIIVSPPPPPTSFTIDNGIGGLGVLEGRLCATYSRCYTSSTRAYLRSTTTVISSDLWVLMEDKDDKEMEYFPWVKKFSLPPHREDGLMNDFYGYRPLGTISPLRILLQSNPPETKGIVSYNPETDHLCCRDIDGDKLKVIPYVKSCVSLKALGETLQGKI